MATTIKGTICWHFCCDMLPSKKGRTIVCRRGEVNYLQEAYWSGECWHEVKNESDIIDDVEAWAEIEYNEITAEKTIDKIKTSLETAERKLRDCNNELCYKCGLYEDNYNTGACDSCRWKME